MPLYLNLDINCDYLKTKEKEYNPKIAWYKVDINDDQKYKSVLNKELNKISVPYEALNCKQFNCNEHCTEINEFTNQVVGSCISAGYSSFPVTENNKPCSKKKNIKAGWNDFCRDKKEIALHWHHMWVNEGRPHHSFNATMR